MQEGTFEWLDVKNQHPRLKSLMMKLSKDVNSSSHIIDANNDDQDFEDLRIINHTEGVQRFDNCPKIFETKRRLYSD